MNVITILNILQFVIFVGATANLVVLDIWYRNRPVAHRIKYAKIHRVTSITMVILALTATASRASVSTGNSTILAVLNASMTVCFLIDAICTSQLLRSLYQLQRINHD